MKLQYFLIQNTKISSSKYTQTMSNRLPYIKLHYNQIIFLKDIVTLDSNDNNNNK